MRDPYVVLGLDPYSARAKDISRAFHRLAKQHHPDVPGGSDVRFKELSQAYEVLADPVRKANWDEFGETSLRVGFRADRARAAKSAPGAWATEDAPRHHDPTRNAWARGEDASPPPAEVQRYCAETPWTAPREDPGSFGAFGVFGAKGPGDL